MVFYSPTKLVNYFVRRLFLMDFYVVFGTNVWDVGGHLLPSCPEWCGFRAIMVWLVGQRGSGCFGARRQQSAGEGFLAGGLRCGVVQVRLCRRVCSAPCCCLQGVGCQFCTEVCQVFFCFGLFLLAVVDVFHLEEIFQQGEFAFLEGLH